MRSNRRLWQATRSKGESEPRALISALNGEQLVDQTITVSQARSREERTGGGFRGGRDRGPHGGYGRRYEAGA